MLRVQVVQPVTVRGGREWGWFFRYIEMPFAPFPGLEIDEAQADREPWEVEKTAWDVKEQEVVCRLVENLTDFGSWRDAEADFLANGWFLGGRGGSPRGE